MKRTKENTTRRTGASARFAEVPQMVRYSDRWTAARLCQPYHPPKVDTAQRHICTNRGDLHIVAVSQDTARQGLYVADHGGYPLR